MIKIVYMGTPNFSVLPLEALIEKYDVVGVVTQPDKKVGRKKEIKYSPVKEVALKNNIKVFQPENIREEFTDILNLNPDLIVTCAYGQIVPKEVLDYPKYKCINIHASLLPKYRGGAPIHRAIINGEEKTGISIMYMDEKMDSGDILYQKSIDIKPEDNVGSLFEKLSDLGRNMIIEFLPEFINGNFNKVKQEEKDVSYAYNITKEDEKISFDTETINVYNKIRGLSPFPVGYSILDGKKIKIYSSKIGKSSVKAKPGQIVNIYKDSIGVKTLDGEILLTSIQLEGKKQMNVKSYLNGLKDKEELIGKIFS